MQSEVFYCIQCPPPGAAISISETDFSGQTLSWHRTLMYMHVCRSTIMHDATGQPAVAMVTGQCNASYDMVVISCAAHDINAACHAMQCALINAALMPALTYSA